MQMGTATYCINCGQLLQASENTFLSMQEIHDRIRRRNMPFLQNIYSLLGITIKDGMQNFADLVLEGKNEFEEYNGLIIQLTFEDFDTLYTFKDNFVQWVKKEIPASDVEFRPSAIIQMTNVVQNLPQTRVASQWSYDKVTGGFYTMWNSGRLHYFTPYPYICEIASSSTEQTPQWTAESGVYLVEDPDYFIDQVSFNVLQRISEYSEMMQLDGFSGHLQLDKTIERLRNRIEENRTKTSDLYSKWINR